ncbi:hypothetical protein RGQ15_05065 [Paracoccus sp. MBLB3053]|uniref:Uncharacterized protein n=1 Tax=Paracoccus aurantius TaxID=3073814 RepID=A0ABU2HPH8_9RHOB|nr:hypothetical protein [Paracoccus sp. MBLB3053]MDS9466948.1 hypothetical protein [Paracoccus sp. MBLB3053]
MSRAGKSLSGLARLASLRSDLEMRRFSALLAHVEAARARIEGLERELRSNYQTDHAFSVEAARLANALAGECSRSLVQAEQDLQKILPSYHEARQSAVREFGRKTAIEAIGKASVRKETPTKPR